MLAYCSILKGNRGRLLCRLDPQPTFSVKFFSLTLLNEPFVFVSSLQLIKIPQVSCKIDRFSPWYTRKCQSPRAHHRAGGPQAVVIQVPEMGQYFQIDGIKSRAFQRFSADLSRLHDNEALFPGPGDQTCPGRKSGIREK
ncbi:hypothetical protein TNCV_2497361 [Trichonephila clavipes]|nr:hypothetical protein TNCV_2497361 [Trichonephila clavipes]